MELPVLKQEPPAVTDPLLPSSEHYDYADSFRLSLEVADTRPAEDWLRAGLERAPKLIRRLILVVHRRVLRFDLTLDSDRILGWRISEAAHEVVVLSTSGPLMNAVIIGRRPDARTTTLQTYLQFNKARAASLMWRAVRPIHQRVAVYLLRRSAVASPTVRAR